MSSQIAPDYKTPACQTQTGVFGFFPVYFTFSFGDTAALSSAYSGGDHATPDQVI